MNMLMQILYYSFVAMALGGALAVVLSRGGLNATMAMLLSMLGMSGMLFMMKAFFLAFIMVIVYAGAVMVLFVFVMMLTGSERENLSLKRRFCALGLWVALCLASYGFAYALPELASAKVANGENLASLTLYGKQMFTSYISLFEITGLVLLVAMVGVIVIAKDPSPKRPKRDML